MMDVIAVFDIGKTNKKVLLIDRQYRIVREHQIQLPETTDEDGDRCEDLDALTKWMLGCYEGFKRDAECNVVGLNVSAYGASLVHLDKDGRPVAPLYNYLKTFPADLREAFYRNHGSAEKISLETASPSLGHLNSGMQLYWLKQRKPERYNRIHTSLHLPQYLAYLFHGKLQCERTSLGCHTQLWDFKRQDYHEWVVAERLLDNMAPMVETNTCLRGEVNVGVGIHDSSAALVPYLKQFHHPFVLLSTGTWSIALHPFNASPLTPHELEQDCLCFMSHMGTPVKASRLLAGLWVDAQMEKLAHHFHRTSSPLDDVSAEAPFWRDDEPARFSNYEEGYASLMQELISRQVAALQRVLTPETVDLFVDGGFSRNRVFMRELAKRFPSLRVYAASLPHASSLGAALVMHEHWNPLPEPTQLIVHQLVEG